MSIRSRRAALLLVAPLFFAGLPTADADHAYHQPVWFTWDTTEIDILVVGVEDPSIGAGMRAAVEAWRAGVEAFGKPQLRDALELRLYIAGLDAVPPSGYEPDDIEIFVISPGSFAVNPCLFADVCGGEPVCSAYAPVYPGDAYRVGTHEIGHCLGLFHVYNHRYEYQPAFDVMGLGEAGRGAHACPSNLNVMTLELVFGALIGLPSGGEAHVGSAAYQQADCPGVARL